jgi:hypothetical protein
MTGPGFAGRLADHLPGITVHQVVAWVEVPHELLVDSGGHVCGPDCPPEPPSLPPLSRRRRARLAGRRVRHWVARLAGLRIAHRDRIDQDRDDR